MSEATDAGAWVSRAEEDYALAALALRRRTPLTYGVCFHAQQCAEKYLKAILVWQTGGAPRMHDLGLLSEMCERSGVLLGLDADQLDVLSSYAVRIRYPGDDPTVEEAKSALRIARVVRKLARQWLSVT